ncbi:MAG: ATPase AAA [Cenarchaeum symbiont of Oopsacas minuta]|nr:ATPase AAA [Cenarchaeum symbiont of Oopsacas minuta]
MDEKIQLKVNEILAQHVNRGIAIVDPSIIEKYGWRAGQILEIVGNRKTHAKLWPSVLENNDSNYIKIDGITRQNAGAGIGDNVLVRSIEVVPAEQIVLSPTEKIRTEGLQGYMEENFLNHVFTPGDAVSASTQMGTKLQFIVTATIPASPVVVTNKTEFKQGGLVKISDARRPRITYDDLGGLKDGIQKIREMIELPMRHPEIFETIGVEAPKGVLLYGPPGTGKTLLAKAVAGETNAHFTELSGPEIMDKHYGASEEKIREIFEQAEKNSPAIIFIDEIDSIAPKRDEVTGEVEKRIVSQLLTLMDGMKNRGKVVVIAATNRIDSIDPALRRPGRFDREIEIGIPDKDGREQILGIHARGVPLGEDIDLTKVASATHGFVGADLQSLIKEAAMRSLRRVLPEIDLNSGKVSTQKLKEIKITKQDMNAALREAHPSAMREILVQVPETKWEDVGGLIPLKKELLETIEWPLKHANEVQHFGVRTPKGILLHGSPGTGKTLIAKAVASTTQSNFISIKGPELLSKWVGESEKGIRKVFQKARQVAPCIIFFDEIDSLVPKRGSNNGTNVTENVVSQILTEMDGLEELNGVLVIGATNRPDMVDPALLRPGRFDKIISVLKPDETARKSILHIHTRGKPLAKDVDLEKISKSATDMSGADLESIVNKAATIALKRHLSLSCKKSKLGMITQEDLVTATNDVIGQPANTEKPSTGVA